MTDDGPHPDVLVVGAGMLAAAAALALANAGASVLALSDDAGPSATEASGAMLGELGEITRRPQTDAETVETDLRARAAARWPGWAVEEVGIAAGRIGSGTFVYANPHRASDEAAIFAIEQYAREYDRPVERVDAADIDGTTPSPGHEPSRALFLPEERFVDARALLRDVWAQADATRRVTRCRATVRSVLEDPDGHPRVRLDDGSCLVAANVLLCSGAGTTEIVRASPGLADHVPDVLSAKGVAITLSFPSRLGERIRLPHAVRSPNRDFACGLHFVPRDEGLYLGATNRATRWRGITGAVTADEVTRLLATAQRELLAECGRWNIAELHWGERALTADGLPIVSETPIKHVHIATGAYRNGILLAPLLADAVAELIGDGRVLLPAIGLGPERSAPARTAEQALVDGLRDYAALLMDPDGPPHRPQLADLLENFGVMAASTTDRADQLREQVLELLSRYPLVEMVPEAVIEACHPELLLLDVPNHSRSARVARSGAGTGRNRA